MDETALSKNAIEQSFILDALDDFWNSKLQDNVCLPEEIICLEKNRIIEAMALFGDNRTHASKHLGISRELLIHKLKKYKMFF
tara:strand:- start:667 stop:915 length:249 start_codon:yes stop_codon:yes gene_type:complete